MNNSKLLGYACIIDRSSKGVLIKDEIISRKIYFNKKDQYISKLKEHLFLVILHTTKTFAT